ncbi:MAG: outer membrane beta-barrel family protein [Spirosomataceae bacterium]
MKKQILKSIVIIVICPLFTLKAQYKVSFEVKDSLNLLPLAYSSCKIVNKNKLKEFGSVSDSLGRYDCLLNQGDTVTFTTNYIGFISKTINVTITQDTIITVLLSPSKNLLDEVKIKGKKAIMENKPDRVVLKIDHSLEKGKKVAETIKKMPFVAVTADALLIKGKSNFLIYKDGLASSLTLQDLKSMPSSLISSIEIIYYPSAKYEGEIEQIVNIITKKDEKFTGGDSWIGVGTRSGGILNTNSAGITFSNVSGLSNSSMSLNVSYDKFISGEELNQNVNQRNTILSSKASSESPDISFSYNYNTNLKKKQAVSLGLSTSYTPKNEFTSFLVNTEKLKSNISNKGLLVNANANYIKTLNNNKSTISLSNLLQSNFLKYKLNLSEATNQIFNTNTYQNIHLKSQLDFEHSFENNLKTESGGIIIYRIYDQNINDFELSKIQFNYNQNILGTYFNVSKQKEKIFFQGGFRFESTQNQIRQDTMFKQFNFLPKLLLSYAASDNFKITFSYSKRIERPDFLLINQFRDISNPLFTSIGNKALQNQKFNSIDLETSMVLGNLNLNLTGIATWGNNIISSLREIYNGKILTSFFNVSSSRSAGILYSSNVSLLKDKVYIFSSGSLKKYYINAPIQENKGWLKSINLGITYSPNKKLTLDFFGNILDNHITLQSTSGNSVYMDFMLNYKLSDRSNFTFRSQNPIINKINTVNNIVANEILINSVNYYLGRTIQLSYTHSFGQTKYVNNRAKNTKIDDLKKEE